MTTATTLPPCPACGSTDADPHPVRLPDARELAEAVAARRVRLGGCLIGAESPDYECRGCGAALPWVAATTMPMTDQIRAAVYGHLVGDAIGVPYEFGHHIETVELRGHGTHNQPPGTWSDDGALMLALLDSLLSVGFDPEDQGRRALAWADARAYTPDGDGAFDIGRRTPALRSPGCAAGTPAIDRRRHRRPRPGQRQPHAHPADRARRPAR